MNSSNNPPIARGQAGFTLVELLIVVLLIGVLAAIGIPQYFKTVETTRAAEILDNMGTIVSAEERYYGQTGSYTTDFTQLDVTIPNSDNNLPYFGGGTFGNTLVGPNAGAASWGYLPHYQVELIAEPQSNCLTATGGYQIWYGRVGPSPSYYGAYALSFCCGAGAPCVNTYEFSCNTKGACMALVAP
jgi:prepilin-type N-terminal cleavage/methylation domain-containing protein